MLYRLRRNTQSHVADQRASASIQPWLGLAHTIVCGDCRINELAFVSDIARIMGQYAHTELLCGF
jgi:hypothetical protein